MTTTLQLLDHDGLQWAQAIVKKHHYLRRPVDPRCSVEGYAVHVDGIGGPVGCLLFGRPEATRCGAWYGSVPDVLTGRCEVTRWQVLNLARVWLDPRVQVGGSYYAPSYLPGFIDRRGVWRSTLASTTIGLALGRVGFDYLLARPPCFPEEPFEIRWVLSYCDLAYHHGTIYRASGFERHHITPRKSAPGLETWRIRLPALETDQRAAVLSRSEQDARAQRYRGQRAQLALPLEVTTYACTA